MTDIIAWKGELILASATWTDKDGHMAKFKVVGDTSGPNPFKYFTKRRKGRAGTRFTAIMNRLVEVGKDQTGYDKPIKTEFMLAGWTDSSTSGHTVTFWLEPPDKGFHLLDGAERNKDSYMTVLVELDDDDTVIDQEKRERVEKATAPREKRTQRLSQVAAMMCLEPEFQHYVSHMGGGGCRKVTDTAAADYMRGKLRISSRSQLDKDPLVAEAFHNAIRKPFVKWQDSLPH